jgi:hypothetical protein
MVKIRGLRKGELPAQWIPLAKVPDLPIWPKQLKELCRLLANGQAPEGCFSFTGQRERPWTKPEHAWFTGKAFPF